MSKIWLDVTTIMGWQRPAVGVVRVEAECASFCLQEMENNIYFCFFDSQSGYQEVVREDVCSALLRIEKPLKSKKDNIADVKLQNEASPAQPLENRLKNIFLRVIDMIPDRMRTWTFNFVLKRKSGFEALIRSFRELRHGFKGLLRPKQSQSFAFNAASNLKGNVSKNKIAPFNKGDVYISLGLDWDQKDFAYLYEQKRNLGFKVLLFCYDLIPVKLPHLCVGDVSALFARYFSNVAWCADEILCISECSKKDLQSLLSELGTPVPSLSVVKLGCQLPTVISENIASDVKQVLDQKYILFVSTIERRKNHETLYRAYTRLIDQGEKHLPLLVFVGMPGWGVSDLISDIHLDPRTKDLIVILSEVADADLVRLYKKTLFTVYPSLYEGWGLPVAESLAAGKFCLASNAASIPEAGEEYAEYIDPWDVQTWADKIAFYSNSEHRIHDHEQLIKENYLPQSWEKTARYILFKAESLPK